MKDKKQPEKKKNTQVRKITRTGNNDELQQELTLYEANKLILTKNEITKLYGHISKDEEQRLCDLYKDLNQINANNLTSLTDFLITINKLEDIELNSFYTSDYDYIKKRKKEKINEINENIRLNIINQYSLMLTNLIMNEEVENYFTLKGHIISGATKLKNKSLNIKETIQTFNLFDKEITTNKKFKKFLKNKTQIFEYAKELMEHELIEDCFDYLKGITNFFKNYNAKKHKQFEKEKKQFLNKYLDTYLNNGFSYAEERKEFEMEYELSKVEQIMKENNSIDNKKIIPVRNTLKKENIIWSMNSLIQELNKKEPNPNYLIMLETKFNKNYDDLKIQAINVEDLDFLVNKQDDFADIINIIRREIPNYDSLKQRMNY